MKRDFRETPLLPTEPQENAVGGILKNSGAHALAENGDLSAVKDAIEAHLKLLAAYLLDAEQTQLP
jgi:glutathione S-transferase